MEMWQLSLCIGWSSIALLIIAAFLARHKARFARIPVNEPLEGVPDKARLISREELGYKKSWVLTILEYPPQKRSVNINGEWIYLEFPYLIFGLVKRKRTRVYPAVVMLHVGFAKKSPTKGGKVYFPPLPHVYEGWNCCLGFQPLSDKEAIELFWNTSFNDFNYAHWLEHHSVNYHGTRLCYKYIGAWKDWAKLSLKQLKEKMRWPGTDYEKFVSYCQTHCGDNSYPYDHPYGHYDDIG